MRRWWAMAVTAAVVVSVLWALRPPAEAGTDLRAARPGSGARLERTPGSVELDLGRPWSGAAAHIEVTGPDDADLVRGRPVATAEGLTQAIAAVHDQGAYQVAYRVPTTDGQVVTGSYWFTYAPPGVATGRRVTLLGSLGLLALMTGTAAVYAGRQRRATRPEPGVAEPVARTVDGPSEPHVPLQRDRAAGDRVPPSTPHPRPERRLGAASERTVRPRR